MLLNTISVSDDKGEVCSLFLLFWKHLLYDWLSLGQSRKTEELWSMGRRGPLHSKAQWIHWPAGVQQTNTAAASWRLLEFLFDNFKAALVFSCTFKLSFTFLILKGFPHRFLHLISWVFCLFVLFSGFLSFPGTEMQCRGQRSTEHSELPGVHSRWHGVIGCGCPLVTLITPAHLWGCHGPATITVVSRTRQQK